MNNYNTSPVSLDMKIGEDEESCLGDFIEDTISESPWHYTEKKALRESLVKAMHKVLTEREIKVIILRFGLDGGEPRTLQEVGDIIGVTRERIRQIEEKAKIKLRRVPELEGVILRRSEKMQKYEIIKDREDENYGHIRALIDFGDVKKR